MQTSEEHLIGLIELYSCMHCCKGARMVILTSVQISFRDNNNYLCIFPNHSFNFITCSIHDYVPLSHTHSGARQQSTVHHPVVTVRW